MSRMRCIGSAALLLVGSACSGKAEGNVDLKVGMMAGATGAGEGGTNALAGTSAAGDDGASGQSSAGSGSGAGGNAGRAGSSGGGGGNAGASAGNGAGNGGNNAGAMAAGIGASGLGGSAGLPEPPEEWGVYDIGEIPPEMTIAFPAPPVITDEVEVASLQAFNEAAGRSGTRVRVTGVLSGGSAQISASDIEVVMNDGAAIMAGTTFIRPGVQRVALLGGRYQQIEMNLPSFSPMQVSISEDVLIDGVVAETSNGTAIRVCAHRAAVLRSNLRSTAYGVYSAAAAPEDRSEDIVIAGNEMFSTGAEASIRLVDVTRSVTVENRVENMMKHTYRIHGFSTDAFAARNVFITAGVGWGFLDTDNVGRAWFNDNEIYHRTTDLFNYAGPTMPGNPNSVQTNRIETLHASGNRAFTRFSCIECYPTPDHWVFEDNTVMPEREPPAN